MNHDRFLTRVYDEQEKKMIYSTHFDPLSKHIYEDNYIGLNEYGVIFASSLQPMTFEGGMDLEFMPFGDRFVPMMCLGRPDKNKKLIYASDIITTPNNKYLVYWEEESAAFWFKRLDNECEILINDFSHEIEIIGNKWENPELLEVEE